MSDAGSTQTIEPPTTERRSDRAMLIGVVVCVVLAVLLTTPALVAYWGQRTLNDTQRYLDTVGPLVHSPEVQDAIATTVTNAIEQQVDIEAVLDEVFAGVITDRPRLQKLVGPLSGAVNGLIDREVREFVASDAFADIWVRVNTRAQQALVRLLKGEEETGAVSLQGDQVVLDLSEVIDQVKQRLVARGLTIVENVPIPDVDKQIVLLDGAAAGAGTDDLCVRESGGPLADPGRGGAVSGRVPGCHAAGQRMTVIIGVALVANALLLAWALSIGRQLFINELAGTVFGPASSGVLRHAGGLSRARLAGAWVARAAPGGRGLVHRVQCLRDRCPHDPVRRPGVGRGTAGRHPARRCRSLGRGKRPLAPGRGGRAWCRRPAVGQRRLGVTAGLVAAARGRAPGGRADPGRGRPPSRSSSERRRAEHTPCMTQGRPNGASTGRLLLDQLVDRVPGRAVVGQDRGAGQLHRAHEEPRLAGRGLDGERRPSRQQAGHRGASRRTLSKLASSMTYVTICQPLWRYTGTTKGMWSPTAMRPMCSPPPPSPPCTPF